MDSFATNANAVANSLGVRYFFFDLDGTLADSVTGLRGSIEKAFGAAGLRMPDVDLRPYIGPGIRTIFANLDPTLTPPTLEVMERAFRLEYDGSGVLQTRMFPGVLEVLQQLHRNGSDLFIVTNKPKLATDRLLAHHGLKMYFADIVSRNSRDPIFASKSEMLDEIMKRYSADSAACLMIGDTQEDADAARKTGMRFAYASYGYGKVEGADQTLTVITQLLDYCTVESSDKVTYD